MTVLLPPLPRSRVALGLTAGAAVGRFELQVCRRCGAVQYPPREACHCCLSSLLDWKLQDGRGELLSETTLRHSHDEFFRRRVPIRLGLVKLDSGPTAVVYLHDNVPAAPARVRVAAHLDRAGLAALVAFAEGGVTGEPVIRMGDAGMTRSRHLREMVCDPKGRKVLVTSADNAVGFALVQALLSAGVDTVWAGYGMAEAQDAHLRQEVARASERIKLVQLDVRSDDSMRDAVGIVGSEVDIVINTAEAHTVRVGADAVGGVASGAAAVVSAAAATELASRTAVAHAEMDINYFGLLRLADALGPVLRARAAAAELTDGACAWVNLLSIYALSSAPGQNTFSASKAAAHSLSQWLRAEMLPAGVRVINVFPGLIDDERARALPPPKLAPTMLARAVVEALQDGVEDVYPGDVAQEWFSRWRDNSKGLERELALSGLARPQ